MARGGRTPRRKLPTRWKCETVRGNRILSRLDVIGSQPQSLRLVMICQAETPLGPTKASLSLPMFNTALRVTDRALSTRERGRSRFPLREPTGPRPRGAVARTLMEREGNDPGASPCLKATDCARNPKTSRAAPRVEVFAERRSSPGIAGGNKLGGSAAESMRSYRAIALDRCPAQPVQRCSRRPRSLALRHS